MKAASTPRALFFDLGKVIVPFEIERAYAGFQAVSTLPIEEMAKRLRAGDLVQRYECGQLEDERFFESFCEITGVTTTFERFCAIWNSIFLPATLVPESLLEELSRNYTLLLLSNTNAIHYRFLERHYGHLGHFYHRVLSHEVGAQKPARQIYEDALAAAGVRPEEVFFTDDLPENIEAARKLGIDGEVFTGVPELLRHLAIRGISSGKVA
ncbi:MAG: HAD family phosphatase [Bryobacterales bacterium]|nr:HAD family phosphatase [Bryobacterales bacterium]